MELKKINCPSCGGTIEIDASKKTGVCKYCNSQYALDDGVIRIEYSFADEETKRKIANANVALYKFKQYKKSLPLFISLYEKFQDNQDFLIGVIYSLTNDFTKQDYSIKEANTVIYYWDLYKKIGDEKVIKDHESEINRIKKLIDTKVTNNKKKKKRTILITAIIALVIILIVALLLFTRPFKKNINIKLSRFEKEVNSYIHKPLLSCSYVGRTINNHKLELTYSCKNVLQKSKNYVFIYDFTDDEAPYVESNTCEFEEGDTPNYDCIKVVDYVDGKITKVDIDDKDVDFETAGVKKVKVKAKDEMGNELSTDVDIKVVKVKITKMEVKVSGNSYRVGGTAKATTTIEPAKLKDKTVTYSSTDSNIASVDNNGTVTFKKIGITEICATSNYNQNEKACKEINVYVKCQGTYIFNLNASSESTLEANEDYCPGTYKIYAPNVLNKDEDYMIWIYYNGFMDSKMINIWKNWPSLSDEGYKASLGASSSIKVPSGIKQVKLVKVS